MPLAMMRGRVPDYASWRPAFDHFAPVRAAAGVLYTKVYRGREDPNEVLVLLQFRSFAEAEAYMGSTELQDAVKAAGAVSSVQVDLFQDT